MSKNNEPIQQRSDSDDPDLTMVERWALQDQLENEIAAQEAVAKADSQSNDKSDDGKSK